MLGTINTSLATLLAVKEGDCKFFHFDFLQFEIFYVVTIWCDC